MFPLFSAADKIRVFPCRDPEEIKCGDVIVFRFPGKSCAIVHRVISREKNGLKTQGDNNPKADDAIVAFENIIGKAVFVEKQGRSLPVFNSSAGSFYGGIVRNLNSLRKRILFILRLIYLLLSKASILKVLLTPFIKIRIFSFSRAGVKEHQLLVNGYVAGRAVISRGIMRINPPFKVFLDELIFFRLIKDAG